MTHPAIKRKPFPLGQRIRSAREEAKVTNARLATELGVDQRTVAGWQAAQPRSRPSYERLIRLAEVLNKPPSYFLGEEEAA